MRLSLFEDDKRIDMERKCLRKGSYATTEKDYLFCKQNNCCPNDRYALPTNDEIKWVFYIKPKSYDTHRLGIVEPANGYDGGGKEAFFDDGTSNDTYFNKTYY